MPRKARIDAPGALHHIIFRGIERRRIFRSDADRENFLNRLGELVSKMQTDCFAWALMPNHVHLLLRSGLLPISVFMSRLLTGYAVWFNKQHRRSGHLFQNRYKSILCQEEPYLKELVRYIHLNPLRSGIVQDIQALDQYPWSGHSVLTGKNQLAWQNVDYVYRLFSPKKNLARKQYRLFVERGIADGRRQDLVGGGLVRSVGGWTALKNLRKADARIKADERILGDGDFVQSVLKAAEEEIELKYGLKSLGYNFDRVAERVAEVFSMKPEDVVAFGKSPQTVKARSLLCFWAHRKLGMTTIELGKKLQLSQSAVSRSSRRGEKIAKENQLELIDKNA